MSKKNKLPIEQKTRIKDFSPLNEKQEEFIDLIVNKEIILAAGVAGSGKTIVSLATALDLLGPVYKNIILIKSVTTIPGESIGFLPGSAEEKMDPFIMSYTWNIDKLIGKDGAKNLMDKGILKVLPIAFIRGLSIDDSVVIIDECISGDMQVYVKPRHVLPDPRNTRSRIRAIVEKFNKGKKIEVLTHNDANGKLEYKEVIAARSTGVKKVLGITIQKRTIPIKVTYNHPMAIFEDSQIKYVPAGSLRVGDRLLLGVHSANKIKNFKNLSVKTITNLEDLGEEEVFNLEVRDNNNYFVDGILTHNCQNLTPHTFKTIVSRIGSNSKYIFLGDIEQIDRKNVKESCLEGVMQIFKDSDIVGTIWFEDGDCVRNPIIPEILQQLRNHGV